MKAPSFVQTSVKEKPKQLDLNKKISQKQTPKNYSLQLNEVVKKILSDQKQHGEEHANNENQEKDLDLMMLESCFNTTQTNEKNHQQYLTNDYLRPQDNNKLSCTNSSKKKNKNRTASKLKCHTKRCDSNKSHSKGNLLNKFYRSNKTMHSP